MNIRKQSIPILLLILSGCFTLLSCNYDKKNSQEIKSFVKDSLLSEESGNLYVTPDQSPLDMIYYPTDYPVSKMNGSGLEVLIARVIYSRPQKKGREIFGNAEKNLRQFGKEWRLGANEATEIEFFEPVMIAGKKIEKGRYVMYCIPYAEKWTIILNSNLYTWGLHMDKSKDIFITDIPTVLQSPPIEDFTMIFTSAKYGADLIIAWDNVKAILPISFKK